MSERKNSGKSAGAFRTISEASLYLDVPQHVLRFWESKFSQVSPLKRGGGRRYYRPEDVQLLERIRDLLYVDGFTIKGVQRLIRERGVKALLSNADAMFWYEHDVYAIRPHWIDALHREALVAGRFWVRGSVTRTASLDASIACKTEVPREIPAGDAPPIVDAVPLQRLTAVTDVASLRRLSQGRLSLCEVGKGAQRKYASFERFLLACGLSCDDWASSSHDDSASAAVLAASSFPFSAAATLASASSLPFSAAATLASASTMAPAWDAPFPADAS